MLTHAAVSRVLSLGRGGEILDVGLTLTLTPTPKVATLSIMGSPELNCDPLLYSLVFGESVLNDAVAIVLFHTFRKFYETRQQFGGITIPIAVS